MKNQTVSLFLLFVATGGALALAQSPGTFTITGNMTMPRSGHTATLLTDGRVLIAGGASTASKEVTAELYDPATGSFSPTGDMTVARPCHSATLLPDGKVLIAGGYVSGSVSNTAEVYDPSTGKFTPTGNMIQNHACLKANLLANGKVLLSGGTMLSDHRVPNAELYDPTTGSFADAGPYSSNRSGFNTGAAAATTLLADGKMLMVWEDLVAETYDPTSGSFSPTGSPLARGYNDGLPTATLLLNGKVLMAGGSWDGEIFPKGAELYDSHAGAFTAAGNMVTAHVDHTATLLPDGTTLLAGCDLSPGELPSAELYNPVTGTFDATGSMITPRGGGQTATLLNNGQVLVAGGYWPFPAITSNAEIYHPTVPVSPPVLFSLSGSGQVQGAVWHAATGKAASPDSPAIAGEVLAMYTSSLADGGVIPPQVSVGGKLAEVLFFGNAPGYPGFNQVNFRVPAGVSTGAAVSVRLAYLGRTSNEITIAVQ